MPYPLTIDPRVGSGDLLTPLQSLKVPAELGHLEFADVQVIGRGPEERPVLIGVEIKEIGDAIRCMTDGRFVAHQLPGLHKQYELVYFLIQGLTTGDENGELQVFKRGHWGPLSFGHRPWRYDTFASWLISQENRSGVRLVQTADRRATALWLRALWANWNLQAWEEHKSHVGMHWKPMNASGAVDLTVDLDEQMKTRMHVAASLKKGIGYEKAKAAAEHFASPRAIVNATETEWKQIAGFGAKLAAGMVAAAEGRE